MPKTCGHVRVGPVVHGYNATTTTTSDPQKRGWQPRSVWEPRGHGGVGAVGDDGLSASEWRQREKMINEWDDDLYYK
jgi:hypothetical protein